MFDILFHRRHIIVKELRIRRSRNTCPTLVILPPHWSPLESERLAQLMFENMNVPGLYLADAPVMAAFGCGVLTALVIDIGHETMG